MTAFAPLYGAKPFGSRACWMLWIVPTLRDGYALAVVFREYTKPEVHGKFQT